MPESVQYSLAQTPRKAKVAPALLLIMAVGCGVSVANLYYSQPLLVEIGKTFHASSGQMGLISMLTQVGFAMGLLFFVPLGDMRERRRLILLMCIAVSIALVGVANAKNLIWLAIASFILGLTTVIPQLIVPLAADMADAQERGKVVGTVMSGLLVGILLARTVSGYVGNWFGWRTMYWLAAVLMLVLALVLRLLLPESKPATALSYRKIMQSMWSLTKNHPLLWESSLMGAALFGTFSIFWTTLAFFLEYPPYHYGSHIVGLFGLVGVVGASVAPLAGRIADKHGPRLVAGIGTVITLVAYLAFLYLGHNLWGLVIGVILLDAGVQGAHISNQATIYSLQPEASNRLNTVYMVSYFIGGALGSALGAYAWSFEKWNGVGSLGLAFAGVGLITWTAHRLRDRRLNKSTA